MENNLDKLDVIDGYCWVIPFGNFMVRDWCFQNLTSVWIPNQGISQQFFLEIYPIILNHIQVLDIF